MDNIRFITMGALVLEHTIVAVEANLSKSPASAAAMALSLVKFGSIAFFLASGFLLGSSLGRESVLSYMGKRLHRVFLPWLCWFSVYCTALVYLNVQHGRTPIVGGMSALHVISGWGKFALDASYWFVPNLLFALSCLLLVRKVVGDKVSGIIWAAASLFYAANIYLRWLPTSHRQAWLGFVFYLWLGAFCARNYSKVMKGLAATPYSVILLGAVVLWLSSVAEYWLVLHLHPQDDPGNSIRITNQLYSLCVVALIAKPRARLSPHFIDVRKDTFGLYLLQPIVLYPATVALSKLVHMGLLNGGWGTAFHVALWILWSALVYFVALGAVKALASTSLLRWSMGLADDKKRRQPVTVFPRPQEASGSIQSVPARSPARVPAA